jgi:hypothetical protein
MQEDPVNRPAHYTQHPSGIECIQITEHMNFCLGNVIKYIWRHAMKGGVKDLKKARFFIDREIARLEPEPPPRTPATSGRVIAFRPPTRRMMDVLERDDRRTARAAALAR